MFNLRPPFVIYVRVSSDKQREMHTVDGQIDALTRWAEREGIAIVAIYRDEGLSGDLPFEKRPDGARMLEDARAGKIGTVLVYLYDRFSRNVYEGLSAARALKAAGAQPFSILEPFDITSPHGEYMFIQALNNAQLWKAQFLARSREGMDRAAKEGTWLANRAPYGYAVVGRKNKARLVIDDEPIPGIGLSPSEIIRRIYRLVAEEGKTLQQVCDYLMGLGVPPPYVYSGRAVKRNIWWPTTVGKMITATTYKGIHRYGLRAARSRGVVIEREIPAIVDAATWDRAQATLRRNLLNATRNAKRDYLLRGLIKCAACGMSYMGTGYVTKAGNDQRYYTCGGKFDKYQKIINCRSKAIGAEIEDIVWSEIEKYLANPGKVIERVSEAIRREQKKNPVDWNEIERLQAEAAKKDGERDALLSLYRRGRIDDASLDRQLDAVEAERAALLAEVEQLTRRHVITAQAAEQAAGIDALLAEIRARLAAGVDRATKRLIIEMLVAGIAVDTEGEGNQHHKQAIVTITYRFAPSAGPDEKSDRSSATQGGPCVMVGLRTHPRK
jgi:site-specific DNA recombinase